MRLDELQDAVLSDGRVGDDKQSVAKGFQLRPTVFFQGVFDRQFVQVELTLQVRQFLGARLFQADPDKVPGFRSPGSAFIEGNIGDFFTRAVHRSSNNSTHGGGSLLLGRWQEFKGFSLAVSLLESQ